VRSQIAMMRAVVLSDEPNGNKQEVRHAHDLSQLADQVWIALWSGDSRLDNPEKPQSGLTNRPGSCID
jgi:hypothetical protein